jgi:hypothetical protein
MRTAMLAEYSDKCLPSDTSSAGEPRRWQDGVGGLPL